MLVTRSRNMVLSQDGDSFRSYGSLASIDSFGRNGSIRLDDSLNRCRDKMHMPHVCDGVRQWGLRAVVCLVPRTVKMA